MRKVDFLYYRPPPPPSGPPPLIASTSTNGMMYIQYLQKQKLFVKDFFQFDEKKNNLLCEKGPVVFRLSPFFGQLLFFDFLNK